MTRIARSGSDLTASSWRRQRLVSKNSEPDAAAEDDESAALATSTPDLVSYGTITSPKAYSRLKQKAKVIIPDSEPGFRRVTSPLSPLLRFSRFSARDEGYFKGQDSRPISSYDKPDELSKLTQGVNDTRLNGIRVWYSSFSSVDWLHDAIKDSTRLWRLRRRKSLRGKFRNAVDRSIDWIVLSIVGFLTACVAWLITRSEQLLFDIKEGHCVQGWWRAKRFCPVWRTWAESIAGETESGKSPLTITSSIGFEATVVEYVPYALFALLFAVISALLTIYLTASPSFITNKDSAVYDSELKNAASEQTRPEAKRKILYFAAGSGIPEIKTILSGFVIHGYLGARTLFTKSVGLTLSVASGLSLGKEGPFVHIACCIGNIISRFFLKFETNEGKRRQILSAAAAAGVAVAFGAPIGGVLFSLEEVSYYFPTKVMWQSFFCAMIAAISLKFFDPFGTGKLVLFQVTYDKDWHAYELIFFVILGVFGGVYGAVFSKLNYHWSRYIRGKTWVKSHPIIEVILVTLITSLLCFLNPYTRMGGTELVYNLFSECVTAGPSHEGLCAMNPVAVAGELSQSIGVALIVKGVLTIVTFGIKLPAGIFIPTLGVGACFGRMLGIGVQYLQLTRPGLSMFEACRGDKDCVIPGLYAMIGAAATLSGVTRTTVSLAVIMFELTDTLTYAGPIMLSILVAKTVADALEPEGIYDLVIDLCQLPYLDSKREYMWGNLRVADVTDRDVDVIIADETNTVDSLRKKLLAAVSSGFIDSGFPVLRRDISGLKIVGYIGFNELEHALANVIEEPDELCQFNASVKDRNYSSTSLNSMLETPQGHSQFDFTVYMDQAPLTVQIYSPLELVQQLFVKLGAKHVIVTDSNGSYEGTITKNGWLAFLKELGEQH